MKKVLNSLTVLFLAAAICLLAVSCSETYKEPTGNAYYDYKSSATRYGTDIKIGPVIEEINSKSAQDFVPSSQESDYVLIKIKDYGDIVVLLRHDVAPITVENFKNLVAQKFYDGTIFHRVIKDFMIQGGGYTIGTSANGTPALNSKDGVAEIKGEFTANGVTNRLVHVRGVISMARTDVYDSATSEFFIVHETSPHLNDKYASFGYVLAGMDVVDAIATCEVNGSTPKENVVIESVTFVESK